MNDADRQRLNDAIRDVHDFPKPGIVFKDITPVLGDGELFRLAIDGLIEMAGGARIDKIVGVDARGFIFGAAAAHKLGIGFVPVRKKGKLPWQTHGCAYSLEYGEAEIEIHKDAIGEGEQVLLIDDLLATGGTAAAAVELLRRLDCELLGLAFLIELKFLNGRKQLGDAPVSALLEY